MISSRQATILEALIDRYIREARPIGSEYLAEHLSEVLSPATIRSVLKDLEEAGYINQPHTSAGRIPTDKGYRYYVDRTEAAPLNSTDRARLTSGLSRLERRFNNPARSTSHLLSQLAHTTAISAWLDRGTVEEAGLSELLRNDDTVTVEAIREISDVLDNAEDVVQRVAKVADAQSHVFIGEENPLFEAAHTSLLVRAVDIGNDERVVLLLVGPKRMPYSRNLAWLEGVADRMEELF